ncbi:hypothetical protein BDV38DRAFT_269010 [Aspergillus pseudotamarii]|uniref:Methyltransferase type 11 domain-containing protein n=1 Tax=Aspergillus pseudotamarii TaxID=132259 RepID=A0A5N6T299_ASPPS|nr:uncharacterized protein BDV38DRAFT_269010 [Aspergillus pseudotamarii]KAE8140399.1 hypothetical protein BDV38DRAFT_269010 [Aspergillus pseudotamarii]
MLDEGRAQSALGQCSSLSYHQSGAESLPFIKSGTIDLVIAVQAAHWFEGQAVWQELKRIVRTRGTVAFWNWGRYFLIGRPYGDAVLRKYVSHVDYLEPMRAVECHDPSNWESITRLEYEPCLEKLSTGVGDGVRMSTRQTLRELEALLRTWSCVHEWRIAHPEARAKYEGGSGDIIDSLMEEMIQAEADWRNFAKKGDWQEITVDIETRTILLLARRRGE